MSLASPSAKNRALGKENLPRVLHSGKNCTRGREAFPSAAEILALGKEQHSAKTLFPECNNRGRLALGKETCYLTVQPANAVKTLKKYFLESLPWHSGKRPFPECQDSALGEEAAFPECPVRALGKGPLPRVSGKALGEEILFFFVFSA